MPEMCEKKVGEGLKSSMFGRLAGIYIGKTCCDDGLNLRKTNYSYARNPARRNYGMNIRKVGTYAYTKAWNVR